MIVRRRKTGPRLKTAAKREAESLSWWVESTIDDLRRIGIAATTRDGMPFVSHFEMVAAVIPLLEYSRECPCDLVPVCNGTFVTPVGHFRYEGNQKRGGTA